MKLSKLFIYILLLSGLTACFDETMLESNPAFVLSIDQAEASEYTCYAGELFYVIKKGDGEFVTLYSGSSGKVWGESGAVGELFTKDSLSVTYSTEGIYNLTVVASSTGKFGADFDQKVKTVKVTVLDRRNDIMSFSVLVDKVEYKGVIDGQNNIKVSVPDIYTDSLKSLRPFFSISSTLAKVYINTVEQISGQTVNDFSQQVVYKVVSQTGVEKLYNVSFSVYASSSEKKVTQFKLVKDGIYGNGEEGVIDETNKTISINLNYGTPANRVKLELTASVFSKYLYNGVSSFGTYTNLTASGTNPTPLASVKVIAQNKSETIYTVSATQDVAFKSFSFKGLTPSPVGVIDHTAKTITVKVLKGTDVSKLIAEWTGTVGKVNVGSTKQVNGTTVNNFSAPIQYKLYKGSSSTVADTYTVTVVILE